MSDQLDAIIALAADFEPVTASLSPDTLAVFLYTAEFLQKKISWMNTENPLDEITDEEWDVIEKMVAGALREIMSNMIGMIITIATAEFPPNVLPCDGSSYARVDYPLLYASLDNVFITDADNFVVPDLRDLVTLGESTTRAIGDTGGEELHQLSVAELASHSHSYSVPDIPTLVFEPGEVPVATIDLFPSATGNTGGDTPHNNMQPYLVLRKGIVAF